MTSPSYPSAVPADAIPFTLRGDYIELDKLLKATGLADSGGTARHWITQGLVKVDGAVDLRKTAKIRAGQIVTWEDQRIAVLAGPADPSAEGSAKGSA